jgi:hypothetical protein
MAASKNKTPDFFKDESFDPVEVATGQSGQVRRPIKRKPVFTYRLTCWIALPASSTN